MCFLNIFIFSYDHSNDRAQCVFQKHRTEKGQTILSKINCREQQRWHYPATLVTDAYCCAFVFNERRVGGVCVKPKKSEKTNERANVMDKRIDGRNERRGGKQAEKGPPIAVALKREFRVPFSPCSPWEDLGGPFPSSRLVGPTPYHSGSSRYKARSSRHLEQFLRLLRAGRTLFSFAARSDSWRDIARSRSFIREFMLIFSSRNTSFRITSIPVCLFLLVSCNAFAYITSLICFGKMLQIRAKFASAQGISRYFFFLLHFFSFFCNFSVTRATQFPCEIDT